MEENIKLIVNINDKSKVVKWDVKKGESYTTEYDVCTVLGAVDIVKFQLLAKIQEQTKRKLKEIKKSSKIN